MDSADGSDLEKVKAAHDWICTHVTYYDGEYNQVASNTGELEPVAYGVMEDYYDVFYAHCAYGAFANRSCVCQGFAHAFKLLMDKLGVDCRVISSLEHDWNVVISMAHGSRWTRHGTRNVRIKSTQTITGI